MTRTHRGDASPYVSKTIDSPVGALKLVASDIGLAAILWEDDDPKRVPLNIVAEDPNHPVLLETERQLGDYSPGGAGLSTCPCTSPARISRSGSGQSC